MQKHILLPVILTALFINCSCIYGQEPTKSKQVQIDTNIGKEVFLIVEVQPEYPGGQNAMQQYLAQNIQYPAKAKENNIQGTVFGSFIVETDGSLSNIKIIKGIGAGCDEEVVRVIQNMPKWKPGTQKGIAVRVKLNMPVKFMFEK